MLDGDPSTCAAGRVATILVIAITERLPRCRHGSPSEGSFGTMAGRRGPSASLRAGVTDLG